MNNEVYLPQHIISIDTETGGFNPKLNALLSIGIAHAELDSKGAILKWHKKAEYFLPMDSLIVVDKTPKELPPNYQVGCYVEKQALEVNKINIEEHKGNKLTSNEIERLILAYLENIESHNIKYSILGQNIKFDLNFLHNNTPCLYDKLMNCYTMHELRTASMMYNITKYGYEAWHLKKTSMDWMRKECNIVSDGQTHSALVDAIDNIKVFSEIQKLSSAHNSQVHTMEI